MYSLERQFEKFIRGSKMFGKKKHEYKSGTEDGGCGFIAANPWIFSIEYYDSIECLAFQMVKFIINNYPDINRFVRIKRRHWNEFLEIKATTCSTKTLSLYQSHIKKLELCAMDFYKLKYPLNWSKGLIVPVSAKTPGGQLLRVQQMSKSDFEKVMEYARRPGTWSRAPIGWMLSYTLGLRVEESADICAGNIFFEGGRWKLGYAEVWGKGKRYRKIDIRTKEDRDYLMEVTAGLQPKDKIVGICKDSINGQLWTVLKALNLKKKYPETSIHAIRKLSAQETFTMFLEDKNNTMDAAIRYVNSWLGHSEERDVELLAVYVRDVKLMLERKSTEKEGSKRDASRK